MKTYEEVADKAGLKGLTRSRFLVYMSRRWGDLQDEAIKCQVGYASEWAERFLSGIEYNCSDNVGQSVLKDIDK